MANIPITKRPEPSPVIEINLDDPQHQEAAGYRRGAREVLRVLVTRNGKKCWAWVEVHMDTMHTVQMRLTVQKPGHKESLRTAQMRPCYDIEPER